MNLEKTENIISDLMKDAEDKIKTLKDTPDDLFLSAYYQSFLSLINAAHSDLLTIKKYTKQLKK